MIEQPTIHLPYAYRDSKLPVSIFLGHLSSLRCEMGEQTATGFAFPFASVYGPFGAHRSATVRAMVPRLAVRTPQPTHLSNPSSPRSRQQPRYWRRFMTLMRPSIPALNLLALLNHPCRSCSSRFSLFFPALGKHTFFPPSLLLAVRSLLSARCGPLPRALAACRTSADDPPGLASAGLHRRHCPPESETRL